jgi:hypothetical protein
MAELYDADGNLVEGALTPEEVAAKEAEIATIKQRNADLESKDLSFKKVRDLTEKERTELGEEKLKTMQERDRLNEEQTTWKHKVVNDLRSDALDSLSDGDADLKAKIEASFNDLRGSDTAETAKEINDLMRKAHIIATATISGGINPINAANNFQGFSPESSSRKGGEKISDNARSVGKMLGISDDKLKNL